MGCRALEVADVFRDHGTAWREANRGHLSLGQLKVMSAIERCRTAALVGLQPTGLTRGGHVMRCENDACGYTAIAYNSCLMGKIRNGESGAPPPRYRPFSMQSFCPLRSAAEHNDQPVRRSEGPLAQVWWNDGLDGLELLGRIAACVDLGRGEIAMAEP